MLSTPARSRKSLWFASWRTDVATLKPGCCGCFVEPERSKRAPGPGRPKRAAFCARVDEAVVELRDRWGGLPSPEESRAIWDDV